MVRVSLSLLVGSRSVSIFKLGTRYSESLGAIAVLDEDGREVPIIIG